MGLITCSKCGKIYDYDKYNGICPKCARYNRETSAAREHQEYHDKYDGGYSHTAQDDHHSYHQRYDSNKKPHAEQLSGVQETLREVMGAEHKVNLEVGNKGKKPNKKAALIIGIVIAVVCLLPFFGPLAILIAVIGGTAAAKKKKKQQNKHSKIVLTSG